MEAEPGGHAPDPHRAAERSAAGNAQRHGLAFLASLRPIDPFQPVGRPAARRVGEQSALVGIAAGPPPQAASSPDDSA